MRTTDVVGLIREIVRHELGQQMGSAFGVVEKLHVKSSDGGPENYDCDVRLRGREAIFYRVPILTSHLGSVAPPAVGDLVLVEFVGGDPDRPVVVGRLYSDALRAPDFAADQILTRLPPGGAEKERLELDLTAGSAGRSVVLRLPEEVEVVIEDQRLRATVGELALELDAAAGRAELTTGGATASLDEGGELSLVGDGDVTIEAGGNLKLAARGDARVEAG
ncbi:MAG: phage baseplate assembly protein V, partial [Acidobacteriota bacterium]